VNNYVLMCNANGYGKFAIVLVGLFCMLYEQSSRATIMLMCDQCLREWHMGMKY